MRYLVIFLLLMAAYVPKQAMGRVFPKINPKLQPPTVMEDTRAEIGKISVEGKDYHFIYYPVGSKVVADTEKTKIWVVFLNAQNLDTEKILLRLEKKDEKGLWEFKGRIWGSVFVGNLSDPGWQVVTLEKNSSYRVIMDYVVDVVNDYMVTKPVFSWNFETGD